MLRRHNILALALIAVLSLAVPAIGAPVKALITGKSIKDRTIGEKDLKKKLVVKLRGKRGAQGAPGAPGPEGSQGPQGPAGTSVFASTVPSGTTITGAFGAWDTDTDQGNAHNAHARGTVSFPVRVPGNLSNTDVNFSQGVTFGDGSAACTGSNAAPTAPPGKVCLYSTDLAGLANSATANSLGLGPSSRFGFTFEVNGIDSAGVEGTWAYTAP